MATLSSLSLCTTKVLARSSQDSFRPINFPILNSPWVRTARTGTGRLIMAKPVRAAPDEISEKVAKSIKDAQEACSDDPVSGECVAAWDEVEELSAAASHARDKKKDIDPLETYCSDNPETDECRTYDN